LRSRHKKTSKYPRCQKIKTIRKNSDARIFQDFPQGEFDEIIALAGQEKITAQRFILKVIRKYLESWNPESFLDVEEDVSSCGNRRVYLILPSHEVDSLEKIMKQKGSYMQRLAHQAVTQYKRKLIRVKRKKNAVI
jgi:hypothetical protein